MGKDTAFFTGRVCVLLLPSSLSHSLSHMRASADGEAHTLSQAVTRSPSAAGHVGADLTCVRDGEESERRRIRFFSSGRKKGIGAPCPPRPHTHTLPSTHTFTRSRPPSPMGGQAFKTRRTALMHVRFGCEAGRERDERAEKHRPRGALPPPLSDLPLSLPPPPLSPSQAATAIAAAVGLGVAIAATRGPATAATYATCYLLEQALSFDNLAVFILVFRFFGVAPPAQERVLSYGLASAAVLRLAMVAAGAELIAHARPVLLAFAAMLLWSALKLSGLGGGGGGEPSPADLAAHPAVRLFRRCVPLADAFDGDRFFTRVVVVAPGGTGASGSPGLPATAAAAAAGAGPATRWVATPLLLVLAVVEISDIVFAVDSVPALFGVTPDPVIVWAATMAAVASLRAMYGLVAASLGGLRFLDRAVAAVLAWVGAKMVAEFCGAPPVPTAASLGVVGACLGVGIAASLAWPEAGGDGGSGGKGEVELAERGESSGGGVGGGGVSGGEGAKRRV